MSGIQEEGASQLFDVGQWLGEFEGNPYKLTALIVVCDTFIVALAVVFVVPVAIRTARDRKRDREEHDRAIMQLRKEIATQRDGDRK
jgi:hypothetical protein